MAGIAYSFKRLYNPEVFIDDNNVIPHKCRKLHDERYHPLYHLKWHGTTIAAAAEELGTAANSVKDGTATPFQVTVVSSDVGDKRTTAAGFVHSVALIGVSTTTVADYNEWLTNGTTTVIGKRGRPRSTVEVVAMNGTTDVLSQRFYLWLDGLYACEWGTGATHDAEGNITAESPANTALLTIAATYNECNGGTWHFPPNVEVVTEHINIVSRDTLAAGDGVAVSNTTKGFDHELNDSNITDNSDVFTYIHYGNANPSFVLQHGTISRYATKAATATWKEVLIGNAQVMDIEIITVSDRQDFQS